MKYPQTQKRLRSNGQCDLVALLMLAPNSTRFKFKKKERPMVRCRALFPLK